MSELPDPVIIPQIGSVAGQSFLGESIPQTTEQDQAWHEFTIFAGPNSDVFQSAWSYASKKSSGVKLARSSASVWQALAIPSLWLLYRRMYGLAVLIWFYQLFLFAPLTLWFGSQASGRIFGAVALIIALYGKRLYVWHARHVIEAIRHDVEDESSTFDQDLFEARLRAAGGVSTEAIMVGIGFSLISIIAFILKWKLGLK